MDKQVIFHHFSTIIDDMIDNSLFFPTYWQAPYSMDDFSGSVDDAAISENIHMAFGISRGCIIDDNFDYVAKFEFESDNYGYSLFALEVHIYRPAKANYLDAYFAEPIFLGTYCRTIDFYDIREIEYNLSWADYDPEYFEKEFMKREDKFGKIIPITIEIPLYAYPRAKKYVYTMFSNEEELEYKSKARAIDSPLKKRNLQIAMEFVFRYGMEQYEKLSEFMEEYDINDLHFGNVGEINGNFICFDYAGYHCGDNDCYSSEY